MKTIEFIKENGLIKAGDRVLCAVSGGADSMCLLHLLHSNAAALEIAVCAASFDHRLRGESSRRDCEFVAGWCAERGIDCVLGGGDVRQYAEQTGTGIEEAARGCRYAFLESAAEELGCGLIATAHNADDNAETMLLNLTRGSGLKGLCGIPPRRGNIVRPLLGTTRAQIEEYLRGNGVTHVEDSTNESDDYTRNVLRHHVMPVLKGINPAFSEAAFRTARLLREDEEYLGGMAEEAYREHYKNGALPVAALRELPKPAAVRVLRLICGRGLSSVHAEAVYSLCEGTGYSSVDIPGMRVSRDAGVLYFGLEYDALKPHTLIPGESFGLDECGLAVTTELIENCQEIFKSFNIFDFKYDSICGKISLTSRAEGDRIRLRYRGCTKSLKDLFSERKMNRRERDLTPVIRDEKGTIAVYGFGIAERCAAEPGDTVIRVKINKLNCTGDN